eukprot:CAMPEP_0172496738 /NCGR_PEP_ID=MMETSP1066-20121228/92047_1 /TAXON_ID=671091 /ORGANISM="Coscinodiscus wailesii, Strain CCMP2513" /LENGTH=97 /DNA_ID=CAMNT_0013269179 /DNA_START=187 /DNA_END=480 /DNA_ORIENTATION=-
MSGIYRVFFINVFFIVILAFLGGIRMERQCNRITDNDDDNDEDRIAQSNDDDVSDVYIPLVGHEGNQKIQHDVEMCEASTISSIKRQPRLYTGITIV